MSRSSTLILVGVLIIIAPFSGFPSALRGLFAAILGAIVIGFGISERSRDAKESPPYTAE